MPTVGSFKGNIVRLFTDESGSYVEAEYQEELTLDINGETIDASYKGTNDWGSTLTGSKSYSWSLTCHIINDGTNGIAQFFAKFVGDTQFSWEIASTVTGDVKFSGTAMVGSLGLQWPKNDVARYTVSANGVGAVAIGTVAA